MRIQENARGHVKAACGVDTCKDKADHSCSDDSTGETKEKESDNNKEGKGKSGTADVLPWRLDPLFSLVWIEEESVGRGFEREGVYRTTRRWESEIEESVGATDCIEGNVKYKSPVKSETEDILKVL